MPFLRQIPYRAGLAGKLFILWLLGVPAGILILIFVLVKLLGS